MVTATVAATAITDMEMVPSGMGPSPASSIRRRPSMRSLDSTRSTTRSTVEVVGEDGLALEVLRPPLPRIICKVTVEVKVNPWF